MLSVSSQFPLQVRRVNVFRFAIDVQRPNFPIAKGGQVQRRERGRNLRNGERPTGQCVWWVHLRQSMRKRSRARHQWNVKQSPAPIHAGDL